MAELSNLRTRLVKGAFKVMQSPRFVRLLQDKRVLHLLVDGMSLRARGRILLRDSGEWIAGILGLATLADLRALELELREQHRRQSWRHERFYSSDEASKGPWLDHDHV